MFNNTKNGNLLKHELCLIKKQISDWVIPLFFIIELITNAERNETEGFKTYWNPLCRTGPIRSSRQF